MNKHAKRNLAAGAACAVGLGVLVAPTTAVAAPITVDPATTAVVNLLHFNDFHGRLDADETVQFAGTIEQLRVDYPESTLLLSGGDNIGASNFTSASQQDEPTIEVLNALEVDAAAVGNHEFDQGIDDLTGRVDDLADFPYLAANVTVDGAPLGSGYETFEVDGMTVAVIGAVTRQTPSLVDGSGIVGVEFGDPIEAVNRVAAEIGDTADVIVAEIHEGADVQLAADASQEEQAATLGSLGGFMGAQVEQLSADVDVVFNGHTHRTYSWLSPAPGEPEALRPIMQSNEYGNLVGQIVLAVDRETGEISVEEIANHERSTDDAATLAATYPRAAAVQGIVEEAVEAADVIGNTEVGTISGPISVPLGSNGNRSEESTAAQMVANMYRDQLADEARGGAEIGVVNPGGVRDSFLYEPTEPETEPGIVRLAEANTMLPFINNLWSITLTGAELDMLLEQQWQRQADGSPVEEGSREYLQLGLSDNVTYISDPSRPIDDRVSDIRIDGRFIAADEEIRVASASFLMGVGGGTPGDNFWAFAEGTDERDSGLVDQDALLAYLGDNPGLAPDFSVRHVDVTGLPTEAVEEGTEVSLQVAQLDRIRSIGAEASTTARVVDASGEVLGSGSVVVNEDAEGAPLTTSADIAFAATLLDEQATDAVAQTFEIRTDNGTVIPFQLLVAPAPEATEPPVDTEEPTETPAPSAPADGDVDGGQAGGGSLPQTGGEVSPMLWVGAGLLVLIGAALLIVGRLRRAEQ